jgi:drug/metabolite transporter (DMT)-like permease
LLGTREIGPFKIVGVIYVVAAVLLWSGIPLLVKQIVPPFDVRWVAMLRLALGTGFLAVAERLVGARYAAGAGRPRWRKRERALLILAGVAIGGDYVLYTAGIPRTTASAANLVVQVEILALSLWSLVILKESLNRAKLAGMMLCFSGVFLVAWNGQSLAVLGHSEYFAGNLLVAAGGVCWSLYALGQKMLLQTREPGETVVPIMAMGTATAAALAFFSPPVMRAPTALQVAYLVALGCLCTGLAYFLMVRGLRLIDASHMALLATLNPLFTMTEAHFLLGEGWSSFLVAGAILIVSGVATMTVFGPGRTVRAAAGSR